MRRECDNGMLLTDHALPRSCGEGGAQHIPSVTSFPHIGCMSFLYKTVRWAAGLVTGVTNVCQLPPSDPACRIPKGSPDTPTSLLRVSDHGRWWVVRRMEHAGSLSPVGVEGLGVGGIGTREDLLPPLRHVVCSIGVRVLIMRVFDYGG